MWVGHGNGILYTTRNTEETMEQKNKEVLCLDQLRTRTAAKFSAFERGTIAILGQVHKRLYRREIVQSEIRVVNVITIVDVAARYILDRGRAETSPWNWTNGKSTES